MGLSNADPLELTRETSAIRPPCQVNTCAEFKHPEPGIRKPGASALRGSVSPHQPVCCCRGAARPLGRRRSRTSRQPAAGLVEGKPCPCIPKYLHIKHFAPGTLRRCRYTRSMQTHACLFSSVSRCPPVLGKSGRNEFKIAEVHIILPYGLIAYECSAVGLCCFQNSKECR